MVKVKDIVQLIEGLAPLSLAEEWDNVGLLIGDMEAEVKKVLVCLDVTQYAVDFAINEKVNLIIAHHPIFFESIKAINNTTVTGRLAMRLIQNNISVYAVHTNLDSAPDGVADQLAKVLELINISPCGYGNIGRLKENMEFDDFCQWVISKLNIKSALVNNAHKKMINRVAVCPGSCGDTYLDAINSGADLLVTGEIKYSCALEAVQNGLSIIEVGHYQSEKIMIPKIASFINEWLRGLQNSVEVVQLSDDNTILEIYTH